MTTVVYLFLIITPLVLLPPLIHSEQKCALTKKSKVVYSYVGYWNEQEQWQSQVGLQNYDVSVNKSLPVSIDVEQTVVTKCEGEQTIFIQANITSGGKVTPKKPPPSDYEFFPGMGWYKFYTKAASWNSANQTCADEGAHLLILNSNAEVDVIKQVFRKTPKELMINASRKDASWVGIVETGKRKYFTIFGEPLNTTGYSEWSPGDPNDIDACVWLFEGNFGLADVNPCSILYPFICEVDL